MSTKSIVAVLIAVLLQAAAPAIAAEVARPVSLRTVNVTGQAEVKVVPNEAIIQVGVETHDKALGIARRQTDEAIARVIAIASSFGVVEKDIRTDYVRVERRGERDVVEHFVVTKDLGVVLRDIRKFEGLLAALVDGGANRVNNVQFTTTELRKHRDRARQLAVIAAREKAQALAGELGLKLGKAILVSEQSDSQYGVGNTLNMFRGAASDDRPTTALGEIGISASVSVSFEME